MAELRILYAEDEPFLSKIVRESLEARGFTVYAETDGKKALALFYDVKPDVCVLDVMLPGKDGFSVARSIREAGYQTPVIFLTAKTQTTDVVEGFETGGNDYIRKPFSMEELIVRIRNAARIPAEPAAKTADEINIGSFRFNFKRQVLLHESGERKLSYRECELIQLLYENRNTIADRRVILKKIWSDDSYFNSRNLDVYVTKLRSYFKADADVEIMTVKGVGYRFLFPE